MSSLFLWESRGTYKAKLEHKGIVMGHMKRVMNIKDLINTCYITKTLYHIFCYKQYNN